MCQLCTFWQSLPKSKQPSSQSYLTLLSTTKDLLILAKLHFLYSQYHETISCRISASLNFQAELQGHVTRVISPFPLGTVWLSSSLTAVTSGDNLVRKFCITVEQLFSNYFLNFHYQKSLLTDYYVRDDMWYRLQIFKTARQVAVSLITNTNFKFFNFFAQNAHPGTDYNCRDFNIRNPHYHSDLSFRKELFIKQYSKSILDLT